MNKAIYVVTYACYTSEIYIESKICFSESDANEQLINYIRDICETEGLDFEREDYDGIGYHEFTNPFTCHSFVVKIVGYEVGKSDTDLICAFFQMLQNKTPDRFDAADEEHFVDVVKRELDYLDETNEYGNVPH